MTTEEKSQEALLETISLISQIESSSISSSSRIPPLSPITVFKLGGILYKTRKSNNLVMFDCLAEAFYELLSNINRDYLTHVIFNDIHSAFVSTVTDAIKSNKIIILSQEEHISGCMNQIVSSSIHSIYGIYEGLMSMKNIKKERTTHLMECVFDIHVCNILAMCYENLLQESHSISNHDYSKERIDSLQNLIDEMKENILCCLSSLLLYGLIHPTKQKSIAGIINEDETIQTIMEVIQGLTEQASTMTSYCLGDLLDYQNEQSINKDSQRNHHDTLISTIEEIFTNDEVSTQKDYLVSFLKSSPKSTDSDFVINAYNENNRNTSYKKQKQSNKNETNQNKISAVDRLIQQVQTILPHLGEGYIEAALACYNHNIEETTNALMEGEINPSSLHPRLRVLDKALPARRKETKAKYDLGRPKYDDGFVDKEDQEAIEIQKARIKEMVASQEDEAYKLGVAMAMDDAEYNDDYDDQYDGIGDGIGGADSGLYDVDFDSIRAYNKVTREMEDDRLFWEENRNLNRNVKIEGGRRNKGNSHENENDDSDIEDSTEVDESKKYRGPDKGKGGRIIGPDGKYLPYPKSRKKGGRVNQKTEVPTSSTKDQKDGKEAKANDQMSKIQKRRKNDNKAKIGNHHRKERALKKTGI